MARGRIGLATMGGSRAGARSAAALSGAGQRVKGVVERAAAAVLLVVLAPVLGVLMLLVRRDSPGPAFFRQMRVGRHGRPFTVFKLRTMCVDADRVVESWPRTTSPTATASCSRSSATHGSPGSGAAALLLAGRAAAAVERRARRDVPGRAAAGAARARCTPTTRPACAGSTVKPGMTGLWQVSGRSDLSWDETVRLDLEYVDNWSWGLDASIVLRTAKAVVGHRGAY